MSDTAYAYGRATAFGAVLLVALGCSADPAPVATDEQAIINGTQSTWNNAIIGVKATFSNGAVKRCTGTMVTRFDALTAAHCVLLGSQRATRVDIAFGRTWNDSLVRVRRFATHPECDFSGCSFYADIAVLSLENPRSGISPAPIAPFDMPEGSFVDAGVVMAGFGAASTDERTGAGVKRWAYATITENRGHELLFQGNDGASPCSGDSGGPLLLWSGSAWEIVGVMAGGGCAFASATAAMPTFHRAFINDNLSIGVIIQP